MFRVPGDRKLPRGGKSKSTGMSFPFHRIIATERENWNVLLGEEKVMVQNGTRKVSPREGVNVEVVEQSGLERQW